MVAVAIGGAAVLGAGASIASGNKAAKAQANAADQAAQVSRDQIAETQRQYDQTRADYAPYRAVGYGALGKLAGMYGVPSVDANGNATSAGTNGYANDGGFSTSPGYKFAVDQGTQAIQRSAASRGLLNSGGTQKAIGRYVTGVASTEYDNYANRLAALAGVGQSATGSTAAAGQSAVSSIGQANQGLANSYINSGNAQASSYANTGSSINTGINNLAASYLYSKGGLGGGYGASSAYGIAGSSGIY